MEGPGRKQECLRHLKMCLLRGQCAPKARAKAKAKARAKAKAKEMLLIGARARAKARARARTALPEGMTGRGMERPEAVTKVEIRNERRVAAIASGTRCGAVTDKMIVMIAAIAKGGVVAVVQLRRGLPFLLQSHLPDVMAIAEDWRSTVPCRSGVMIGIVLARTAGRAGPTEVAQAAMSLTMPFPEMTVALLAGDETAIAKNGGKVRHHMATVPGLGASSDPQISTEPRTPNAIAHRLLMTAGRAVPNNLVLMLAGGKGLAMVIYLRTGRHTGATSITSGTIGTTRPAHRAGRIPINEQPHGSPT
mmetsp:Transcript_90230/g.179543  ORF Transcript_90230/g.179543 Transcript_90230/m.179543 type:complete len:306 (-) Transcript_90230:155-1072(-)